MGSNQERSPGTPAKRCVVQAICVGNSASRHILYNGVVIHV